MATLVLSSAGAALGGPIGAAAGRMVGGQIDRGLRGSRSRGRLSDFRVQVSHYGAEVPAIYGKMRVAGTVVWATDLIQSQIGGKAGSSYGYTVSFAIALSSRTIVSVKRIWADGRLIRGAAGDQKIAYTLRLRSGDPDQLVDPLMASTQGLAWTPAYRDLGLLIFEDFDLSTFGNRLPQITVEIDAGDGSLSPSLLLSRLTGVSSTEVENEMRITGFAAQGDNVGEAIAPLLETFEPRLSVKATAWEIQGAAPVHLIPQAELQSVDGSHGNASGSAGEMRAEPPTRVSLRYFDPALDYATGEKSARLPGREILRRIEFPGAISSDQAKGLAHQRLTTSWAQGHRRTIALPLHRANIGVGDTVMVQDNGGTTFRVAEKALVNQRLQFTLIEQGNMISALRSNSGAGPNAFDEIAAPLKLVVLDGGDSDDVGPAGVYVGVSGGQSPFRAVPLQVSAAGRSLSCLSARRPVITGQLIEPLEGGSADLLDKRNSLLVRLDSEQALLSVEFGALLAGANIAWAGGEYLQFATAEEIEPRVFRLSALLRGRRGSGIANLVPSGTEFVMLDTDRLAKIPLANDAVGSEISVEAIALDGPPVRNSIIYTANRLKPWAPSHLTWSQSGAAMELAWVRCCPAGLAWLDFVDVPEEKISATYRVALRAADGSRQIFDVAEPRLELAANLTGLGPRPWSFEVRQIGLVSLGSPAQLTVL